LKAEAGDVRFGRSFEQTTRPARFAARARRSMENTVSNLVTFLEIDEETRARGSELWELLQPHADAVVDRFYEKVKSGAISNRVTDEVIAHLKGKQKERRARLFAGRFDADYVNGVRQVGIRHRDITLNPMWFVAGYMALKIAFMNGIAESPLPPITKGRFIKMLDKYTVFNMAIAMSAYNAVLVD
jgi:hypothetical protein